MTKYDERDDNRDNDGNEFVNDDDNATAVSVSDGPIFDPITMPWSRLGLADEDRATTATLLWLQRTMYPHAGLYIYPIKSIVKIFHKLLYTKIGVLDLCFQNTKKPPV